MPDACRPHVQVCATRIARLEGNGVPDPGADNMVVSNALGTLTASPVYREGEEIQEPNACGELLVNFRGSPTLVRWDISFVFQSQDPFLAELLSNGTVLTFGADKGYASPPLGDISNESVSLEVWAKRVDPDTGDLDIDAPYAWYSFPKLKNLRIGERVFANANIPAPFTAEAYENPNWYNGPTGDWPTTVPTARAWQWIPWDNIPTPSCGFKTISAS